MRMKQGHTMATNTIEVQNNHNASRFEAKLDGQLAVIEYVQQEGIIAFTHTEVPDALEGRGIASRMAQVALEYAREQGLRVLPLCPFVASYIKRHPEYQSLVVDGV
jgi:uncharacterized protein